MRRRGLQFGGVMASYIDMFLQMALFFFMLQVVDLAVAEALPEPVPEPQPDGHAARDLSLGRDGTVAGDALSPAGIEPIILEVGPGPQVTGPDGAILSAEAVAALVTGQPPGTPILLSAAEAPFAEVLGVFAFIEETTGREVSVVDQRAPFGDQP